MFRENLKLLDWPLSRLTWPSVPVRPAPISKLRKWGASAKWPAVYNTASDSAITFDTSAPAVLTQWAPPSVVAKRPLSCRARYSAVCPPAGAPAIPHSHNACGVVVGCVQVGRSGLLLLL